MAINAKLPDNVAADLDGWPRPERKLRFLASPLGFLVILLAALGLMAAGGYGLFVLVGKVDEYLKVSRAKRDIKKLDDAAHVYKSKYKGQWPGSLEMLYEPDPNDPSSEAILTDRSILVDPWNQQYVYEPGGLLPSNKAPRIYSPGPSGKDKPISNWD